MRPRRRGRRARACSLGLSYALVLACYSLASLSALADTPSSPFVPGAPVRGATPIPVSSPENAPRSLRLSILTVEPSSPVAGQQVTITYLVRNLSTGPVGAHVSGGVRGVPAAAGGRPPVDTVFLGSQEAKGTLVTSAGPAGPATIDLTLSSTPCGVTSAGGPACAETMYARATTPIVVAAAPVAPVRRVRIAGLSYAKLHLADARDGTISADGYVFVVHDPGCRSNFSSGNSGNDTFFKKRDLPAGAVLRAVDFTLWRVPDRLTTQYYAGGAGGYGSYGVKVEHDAGDAMHVHWENACRGPYSTFPVVYSISFEIDVPAGTDLGESATLATLQPSPPSSVNYTTLGAVPGSTNAAAALVPEPAGLSLRWDGETYSATYAPAAASGISAVQNLEPNPIVLIADRRLGAGCAPGQGNLLLQGRATTTPEQFAALYGSTSVPSPRKITACVPSAPASKPEVLIELTVLQH